MKTGTGISAVIILLLTLIPSGYVYSKDYEVKKFGSIDLARLDGGTFTMGSDTGKKDEKPMRTVTLDSFWIGRYEVTQKQYSELMGKPVEKDSENLPVVQVSYDDALEFCRKFSAKYNVKARLPYEAEWEYACRGGTAADYYWGNSPAGDYCWYLDNSGKKIHPVGGKKPNAFGLYDMNGNVWEWCIDWYGDGYKPGLAKNPSGPEKGNNRVLRGGSWNSALSFLRSSNRNRNIPANRNSSNGFRIVVTD